MPTLYIWLEGDDDERFFAAVVRPLFADRYDRVEFVKYAQKSPEWRRNFLKGLERMGAECLYVTDLDRAPCYTFRKEAIVNRIPRLHPRRIFVVRPVIEGWYLAGLSEEAARKLRIELPRSCDECDKQKFNALIPQRYDSRLDFTIEVLKQFSVEEARRKSTSFDYLLTRHGL
jgi:hypothetical protein